MSEMKRAFGLSGSGGSCRSTAGEPMSMRAMVGFCDTSTFLSATYSNRAFPGATAMALIESWERLSYSWTWTQVVLSMSTWNKSAAPVYTTLGSEGATANGEKNSPAKWGAGNGTV